MTTKDSTIRKARLADVPAIKDLINSHAELGRMLFRSLANLYDAIRDFTVIEEPASGRIIACGALQVVWKDLAEVKSLAVDDTCRGRGLGTQLAEALIAEARDLTLPTVFTLTMEPRFFQKLGFQQVEKEALPMKVWSDCIRCPKQDHCDEIAMILTLNDTATTSAATVTGAPSP